MFLFFCLVVFFGDLTGFCPQVEVVEGVAGEEDHHDDQEEQGEENAEAEGQHDEHDEDGETVLVCHCFLQSFNAVIDIITGKKTLVSFIMLIGLCVQEVTWSWTCWQPPKQRATAKATTAIRTTPVVAEASSRQQLPALKQVDQQLYFSILSTNTRFTSKVKA